jgi:Domain of unknown function (DUF1707)
MSDAEREQVVARLQHAVGEGRLTLPEFEERVTAVLHARTYADVEPHLADLPAVSGQPVVREVVELRNHASGLKRDGRWIVPRRLVLSSKAGSTKLNFVQAVFTSSSVEIDIEVTAGSTELVLPRGASADVDEVEMIASSVKSKVLSPNDPGATGPRFVVRGRQKASSLKVRYERRFLRWRW